MGIKREWTDEQIQAYVSGTKGNLTQAAKNMSKEFPDNDKVTRQNLQTWINGGTQSAAEDMDNFVLSQKNRNLANANATLRRENKLLGAAAINKSDVVESIKDAVKALPAAWPMPFTEKPVKASKKLTIELLFSDLQIGKLMDGYDSKVAQRRVDEWIEVAIARIKGYAVLGYEVEKIILAVLGDVIESDKKHENSGRGCDIGTADQMHQATELLFHNVIKRLALLNIKMDVVLITGNHDHDGHGLAMFMPGREHLSWPMYNALKMLSDAAGINAEFFIPEGSHHIHNIYGANVLYEHGVGVSASEASMKAHVAKRINQTKEYIHLFRMGDKHNICRFNNDRFTVNGAFFGDDRIGSDYSGIKGYDGEPAQVMFAYTQRDNNRRTPIFDSLVIQLGHIT